MYPPVQIPKKCKKKNEEESVLERASELRKKKTTRTSEMGA